MPLAAFALKEYVGPRRVAATAVGFLGDIPNTMTMLGAGIVMASTIYITLRESRVGAPKPPPERVD